MSSSPGKERLNFDVERIGVGHARLLLHIYFIFM